MGAPLPSFTKKAPEYIEVTTDRRLIAIDTFEEVTEEWLKTQDHIGDSHPLAFSVMAAAKGLDNKNTIALYKEYNALVKHIARLAPPAAPKKEKDPLLAPANGAAKSGT